MRITEIPDLPDEFKTQMIEAAQSARRQSYLNREYGEVDDVGRLSVGERASVEASDPTLICDHDSMKSDTPAPNRTGPVFSGREVATARRILAAIAQVGEYVADLDQGHAACANALLHTHVVTEDLCLKLVGLDLVTATRTANGFVLRSPTDNPQVG
ncbi:hypothetical protein J6595_18460 [Jiella sp. KSK16Y-1]|uniref:Uncharacterized protein n=2 Tax=Jiella mangrovi TaxID=2821407 RepID=A0ABS4BLG7_9HYPH|nr:hypothetical protein [Jiella mangrovi]